MQVAKIHQVMELCVHDLGNNDLLILMRWTAYLR